jgi:hypothetical protein
VAVASLMDSQIVAPEEVIQSIEQHKDTPHEIADSTYVFTHKTLTFLYNGDQVCEGAACASRGLPSRSDRGAAVCVRVQVIEVNLTSEAPEEIVAGKTYRFTYSVDWTESTKPFDQRFNRYLDYSYVPALACRACTVQRTSTLTSLLWCAGSLSTRSTGSPSSTPS